VTKIIIAVLLALAIGAACRLFEIPLPAPPTLLGVGLIFAITIGYMATDRFVARRSIRDEVRTSMK
jgi:XapX domain-containing protein